MSRTLPPSHPPTLLLQTQIEPNVNPMILSKIFLVVLPLAWFTLGGAWAASAASTEPDLLEAEVAFRFSARLKDAKTIEVGYVIAPGYYLYRERFGFALEGAAAGKPALPRGKNTFDATFNKTMEVYRGAMAVTLPLKQTADAAMTLRATSQGCADAGVCYPPQVHTVRLMLSSAANGLSVVPAGAPLPSALTKAPAAASSTAAASSKAGLFQRVTSMDDVQQRVKAAGRVALLDFYADWCAPCKQMEKVTLSDQRVKAKLAQFAALQADVTRNTLDDKLLLKHYKLVGPPGIVFFDRNGQEMPGLRVIGFEAPEKFLKTLDLALAAR